ncbi:hypothetical protein NKH77_46530 [Streptomyces sp. M19]
MGRRRQHHVLRLRHDLRGSARDRPNLNVGPVDYLSVNVYERGDGTVGLQFEVDAARCGPDELAVHQSRVADFFARVALADEDTTVGGIDILSPADFRLLMEYGDGGTAPVPPTAACTSSSRSGPGAPGRRGRGLRRRAAHLPRTSGAVRGGRPAAAAAHRSGPARRRLRRPFARHGHRRPGGPQGRWLLCPLDPGCRRAAWSTSSRTPVSTPW